MAKDDDDRPAKISNGPNARPKDETIAQTGPGLPDDSSPPGRGRRRGSEAHRGKDPLDLRLFLIHSAG